MSDTGKIPSGKLASDQRISTTPRTKTSWARAPDIDDLVSLSSVANSSVSKGAKKSLSFGSRFESGSFHPNSRSVKSIESFEEHLIGKENLRALNEAKDCEFSTISERIFKAQNETLRSSPKRTYSPKLTKSLEALEDPNMAPSINPESHETRVGIDLTRRPLADITVTATPTPRKSLVRQPLALVLNVCEVLTMDSTQPKAADLTARPPLNDSLVHRDPPVKSDVQLNDARRKWPEDFRSTSGEVREYSVWKSARRRKDDIDTSGSNLHSEELPASIERAPSAPVYIGTLSIGPHQAEPEPVQMSAAAPRTPRRRDLEERHARLMDASPRLRQIFERRRELSRATDGTESTRAAQPVPQSPDSVSQSNAVIRHGMVPQGDGILPSEAARQVVPELPHSALKEVAHGFSGRWACPIS